ncbi:MAG: CDP-diacylglycerol--glycerol-3-phosphate 3-phosphatidyltransferase [Halieaceae bacterium]|nr:CDP-diacylglycerol--glycerol-3-phosphate 3-phosphatidyltransferase [Halieaceae bacterium]
MNIPNSLTITRVGLIPLLVLVFYWPFEHHRLLAASIFALAAITDWLDGYLARKLGQLTRFGAFLDPVADKLMVTVALVLLVEQQASLLFTLAACVIIGRELVMSALREWMAEQGQSGSVAVSRAGKVKTFVQMLAIFFLLALNPVQSPQWALDSAQLLIFAAAVLALYSLYYYMKSASRALVKDKK